MVVSALKSKIHRATVTDANIDYVGSISIDKGLMRAANLLSYERVQVLNITNGNRLETYAIASEHKGHICINGAAAHLVSPDDLVIIVSYGQIEINQASDYMPQIVYVDNKNHIIKK